MGSPDRDIVRDLAARLAEVCADPDQARRRDAWRTHNSLRGDRPLIYVRAFAWDEMDAARCVCTDPFLRRWENHLRNLLFWASIGDDSVFEPWVELRARHRCAGWGIDSERRRTTDPRGSFKADYALRTLDDIARMRDPWHEIDEAATAEEAERLSDALGGALPVVIDRAPAYRMWTGDISTDLGYLRGIEHFMLDMADNPDGLHRLVGFMADGIRRTHEQAEAAGHWTLIAHENQAMPYAEELPDPSADPAPAGRRQLWGYMAAQEFTGVSPAMFDEFLFRYQEPILAQFGLTAYGCCENLTRKIPLLRRLPNLRRIAVAPCADVRACAEQIGRDYVVSYRPSPTDMVGYGFDPDRIRSILRDDLGACRGCHVDITLKDVETVEGDPTRIRRWVELTRGVIGDLWG